MNLNEILISQYIDDELNLREKLHFLEELAKDEEYSREAISLVSQEILLENSEDALMAEVREDDFDHDLKAPTSKRNKVFFKLAGAMATAACVLLAFIVLLHSSRQEMKPEVVRPAGVPHRFVLYMPDAKQVAISGSFNDWARVPMEQPGNSGYWEADLVLSPGEYRFSYLVEQNHPMADPTILAKERDGFGGMNSILKVERQI